MKGKGWYDHSNRNFQLFYEEIMKLLKNRVVLDTETEFLNQLRRNALVIVDPLDDDVLVRWGTTFKKIEKMFSKDLRDSVRVEAIIRDQTQGWRKLRDTHPSMGYLFDEYTNRKRDVIIESIDDFRQLTFDIVRSMQKVFSLHSFLRYV